MGPIAADLSAHFFAVSFPPGIIVILRYVDPAVTLYATAGVQEMEQEEGYALIKGGGENPGYVFYWVEEDQVYHLPPGPLPPLPLWIETAEVLRIAEVEANPRLGMLAMAVALAPATIYVEDQPEDEDDGGYTQ